MVEMPIRILERELKLSAVVVGRGEIATITDKPPGNRYFWRRDIIPTHYPSLLADYGCGGCYGSE